MPIHAVLDPRLSELAGSGSREELDLPDAIVVEDVRKRYADGTDAVRGISFRVATGEVFGLLGPNGAGKSTTVGMLGTLVRPSAGRVSVAGFDTVTEAKEVRRRIGFAMQEVGVDELATGSEFLVLQGRLMGLARREADRRAGLLIELLGLEEAAGRRMADYSGGMKRRVDLASALIHLPPVLFLDEPTEGLDPRSRVAFWETLTVLRERLGITLVLSTHYMDEGERLCDRIAIIDAGRIVAVGTPEALKAGVAQPAPRPVALHHATLEDRLGPRRR
jgi:ABC-2 type transport system ATP-binding protein